MNICWKPESDIRICMNIQCEYSLNTLVEHFKFFGLNIGGKCFGFLRNFALEKYVKNLKLFHHFLILFQNFHLELKKYWKSFKFFMCIFGESFLKNAKHFSPIFTLKNLKCSASDSQQYSWIFVNDNYSHSVTFEYLLFVNYSWITCISSVTLHTNHLLLSTTTITFNAACHPPEC
jgi:hypothetical protein